MLNGVRVCQGLGRTHARARDHMWIRAGRNAANSVFQIRQELWVRACVRACVRVCVGGFSHADDAVAV